MDLTEAEQVIWSRRFAGYTNEMLVRWAESNEPDCGTSKLVREEIERRVEAGTFRAASSPPATILEALQPSRDSPHRPRVDLK